jgi:hypothetical protein
LDFPDRSREIGGRSARAGGMMRGSLSTIFSPSRVLFRACAG